MSLFGDARDIVQLVTDPRTLRQVIGDGVRRAREAAGVRQDDVSRSARAHGLAWSRAKVAALEAGEKAINADELILLPLVLTDACRRPVTLSDLINPAARIALSPVVTAAGHVLPKILASDNLDDVLLTDLSGPGLAHWLLPDSSPETASGKALTLLERHQAVRERLIRLLPPDATGDDLRELLAGIPSEAERKVAGRLGEDPQVILAVARLLWGRSLADERDRLVDERADAGVEPDRLRALRGRVTRHLVEQVAAEIERRETGGSE